MAFKIELLETGIYVTNTIDTTYKEFINPSNCELAIDENSSQFWLLSPKINRSINLGTFDNIRKDDDSIPSSIQDAIEYLSDFIY